MLSSAPRWLFFSLRGKTWQVFAKDFRRQSMAKLHNSRSMKDM